MKSVINLYFAYGSNMNDAQMAERCSDFELYGNAVLINYQFVINSRGVATVVQKPGKNVHGVVWSLSKKDIASLDRYEGVKEGLYRKEKVLVRLVDIDDIPPLFMLAYIAEDSTPGRPREGYLDKILAAARLNEFPDHYTQELQGWMMR